MIKIVFIGLLFHTGQILSQTTDTTLYHALRINFEREWAQKLHQDSLKQTEQQSQVSRVKTDMFDRIFGSSDTLADFFDKSRKYFTVNDTMLVARKINKELWKITSSEIFKRKALINYIGFYEVNKQVVIRVNAEGIKEYRDINPKNGKLIK